MDGFHQHRLSFLSLILVLNPVFHLTVSTSPPDDSGACQNAQLIADEGDRLFNHTGTNTRCDQDLNEGWYRFSFNGQPAEIPTSCVKNNHCGTQLPLHLDLGGNDLPAINQTLKGYVCTSFDILGFWDCCVLRMTVYVRNCSGYYIYHLQPTDRCPVAYCLQVESNRPSSHVTAKTGESVGSRSLQSNEDEQLTTTTLPLSASTTVPSFGSTDFQIETSTALSPSSDPPSPALSAGSSDMSISSTPPFNSVTPSSQDGATANTSKASTVNSSPEESSTIVNTTETSTSAKALLTLVNESTTLSSQQMSDPSDSFITSTTTVVSTEADDSNNIMNERTTSVKSDLNETSSPSTTTASLSGLLPLTSTESSINSSSATDRAGLIIQSALNSTDPNRTCRYGLNSFQCGNNTCYRDISQIVMLCVANSTWQCVQACDAFPDCDNEEDEDQALCGGSYQVCSEGTHTCPNREGCFMDCNGPVMSYIYPIRFIINGTGYRDGQKMLHRLPPLADVKRAVLVSLNNHTGTENWDNGSVILQSLALVDGRSFVIEAVADFNVSEKGVTVNELVEYFQNDTFLEMIAQELFGNTTLVVSTPLTFVSDTEQTVSPSSPTTIRELSTQYETSTSNERERTQTSETFSFTSETVITTELMEQNENNTTVAPNKSGVTEDNNEFNVTSLQSTTVEGEVLPSRTTISTTGTASINSTQPTTTPVLMLSSSPDSPSSSESTTASGSVPYTNNATTSLQESSSYTIEMQTTPTPLETLQTEDTTRVYTLTNTMTASSEVSTGRLSTEINNQTISDETASTQVASQADTYTTVVKDESHSTGQPDQTTDTVSERQDTTTHSVTLSSIMSATRTQNTSIHIGTTAASFLSSAVSSLHGSTSSTVQTTLQTSYRDNTSSPRASSTTTISDIDRTMSAESVPVTSARLYESSASTSVLSATTQGQLTTESISPTTFHLVISTGSPLAPETSSTHSSSPQVTDGLESTYQTHGQTTTRDQLSTSYFRLSSPPPSSSISTSAGFKPSSTSSRSTEGISQTSQPSLANTETVDIETTEKVNYTSSTTELVTSISNGSTEALSTVGTRVDDEEEEDDKDNVIVKFFKRNTGLFIFIVIAGAAMLAICIFGIAGTIYQRRMRTWTPKINYKDVYPDMEKSMIPYGQERSGIESPILDIDILQEEQTGEDGSLSKASTLVCGPTPDRIQGTSARSYDTPVTGASSAASLNGHANEAYQSDESLDLDGVTPFDELDEQFPRNKFPWIDNAEDTKV